MRGFAVLGCGPAGLLAVHSLQSIFPYAPLRVFSRKRKSTLYGAQYLHREVPGITGDAVDVEYVLEGEPAIYRAKVYGTAWSGSVSPEDLEMHHKAWDIRAAYDKLWDWYSPMVEDVNVTGAYVEALVLGGYAVINSIPRNVLCMSPNRHEFKSVEIKALGDVNESDTRAPFVMKSNTVVCNGTYNIPWYRISNVFDYHTIEWPANTPKAYTGDAVTVHKPLSHDCDCHPAVIHVGRYGCWDKGQLASDAFETVRKVLNAPPV